MDTPTDNGITVLNVRYRYVGDTIILHGKVALLPSGYGWMEGFDSSIDWYVDLGIGETLEDLYSPTNPYGFYIVEEVSRSRAVLTPPKPMTSLELMAAVAMEEYRRGKTKELNPNNL